jgi:LytS/YehU family sensor histidine kinase
MAALLAATKSVWPGGKSKNVKSRKQKAEIKKPKAKLNFHFLLS